MRSKRLAALAIVLSVFGALSLSFASPARSAFADDGHGNSHLQAIPFTFVGSAADCGGTAGSRIVTAAWLNGFGLPDNGGQNGVAATARDPHTGLLLSKNGPTTDCSAAGARIAGLQKNGTLSELGFDFRDGTHCGAGAPRFNITTTDGNTYFAGCADGTIMPAPQDPAQWSRVRFSDAQVFPAGASQPPFQFGVSKVKSVELIFDEGTDTPSAQDPNGTGLVNLDNIDVNGTLITSGPVQGSGGDDRANDRNGDNGRGNND